MLHLSLAGNILLAVGGKPKLYDPKIIPSYPMLMEGRVPPLTLHLRKMTKANLETFIQACLDTPASWIRLLIYTIYRLRNQNRQTLSPRQTTTTRLDNSMMQLNKVIHYVNEVSLRA
jgi:hypothetical protein